MNGNGEYDADWREVATFLAEYGGPYGELDDADGNTSQTNLISRQRCNVRGSTLDGNSGCPVFIVVDDALVLLFSKHLGWLDVKTWTPSWGPMLTFRLEAVQSKIDEWEGADAGLYQVETLDLSAYDGIVNQPIGGLP